MRAIRFFAPGDASVLVARDVPIPTPGPGQVLLRNAFVGVNMIDTYHRNGLYPRPAKDPAQGAGLGGEAAGVVAAVGAGVEGIAVGDRVATASAEDAYAAYCVCDAARAIIVPQDVALDVVAATLLKGMTARYLCKETYVVGPGTTALVHAAAGGTGSLLLQFIKHLGGIVVAVVSSAEKAERCRALGADHVVLTSENLPVRVRELLGGRGVDVVYDSVGRDTFMASLDSLRPRGMMVTYGNASGPVPDFSPLLLSSKGSLYLTRPTLMTYTADRASLVANASDVFAGLKTFLRVEPPERFPLDQAADAHRRLESRKTMGALVLQV